MNKDFSIYDSPFSDETKRIRRNSLLASGLCLFIGLTGELPEKFALFGVTFSSAQQNTLGWFIFSVSLYFFVHFMSVACVEIARWIHPFYAGVLARRKLLKHPAFDITDFVNVGGPIDKHDIAGSRYFCESLFWASQPKQAAKT
jgi:hypothetical protein